MLYANIVARNNARIRRRIAEILFEKGSMTRLQMASILLNSGEFRNLPNDSSLTAMLAKNLQIKQVGHEMIDSGDGIKTKQTIYAIDDEIIKSKRDLVLTRPYSTMTANERKLAKECPSCKQMRIIEDKWGDCIVCVRKQ